MIVGHSLFTPIRIQVYQQREKRLGNGGRTMDMKAGAYQAENLTQSSFKECFKVFDKKSE